MHHQKKKKQSTIWQQHVLLASIALYLLLPTAIAPDSRPTEGFSLSADIPEQRQALLAIFKAVGNRSELGQQNTVLPDLGYTGNSSWGSPAASYCWWWGVTCCGASLTIELPICSSAQAVSALDLPAVGLRGTLPDVFGQLTDLQVLDVSYNRGKKQCLQEQQQFADVCWAVLISGGDTHTHSQHAHSKQPEVTGASLIISSSRSGEVAVLHTLC